MDLNALSQRCHEANKRWWLDPATGTPVERNKGQLLMLMVSELAEAMEGARKNKKDDHLPHLMMEEVELADLLIRLFDYMGGMGYLFVDQHPENDPLGLRENKGEALMQLNRVLCRMYDRDYREAQETGAFDVVCGVLEYSSMHGLNVMSAFEEKMAYNAKRYDHTNEARLAEGGKKW